MTRLFSSDNHYVGQVVAHDFTTSQNQQPTLKLSVKLIGKAKAQNEMDGFTPLEEASQLVRTLYLDLDPNGPKLDRVMKELAAIGYTSTDPRPLHPQHPKHKSLLGKQVLVRVWYKPITKDDGKGGTVETETDKWFIVTARKVETFDLGSFDNLFRDNADAYVQAAGDAAD
jgi:hypothetical protein